MARVASRLIGELPELVSYVVLYIRLNPNLERAFQFFAENSSKPLAGEIKRLLWKTYLGFFPTLRHGLDELCEGIGKGKETMRRAFHLICAAVDEKDPSSRESLLNRALNVSFDGALWAVEERSSQLHQPIMLFFSFLIVVPLALVAMLPAASVVGLNFSTFHLILIYNLILPAATIAYAEYLVSGTPMSFASSPSMRNLPKSAIIASCASVPLLAIPMEGCFTALAMAACAVSLTMIIGFAEERRMEMRKSKIEEEIPDALFVLGSRISEGKSAEDAIAYASSMKGEIGKFLREVRGNLAVGLSLEDALFHPLHGAATRLGSDRVRAAMKLFLESARKSSEDAGKAVIRLADHMRELRRAEERMRRSMGELSSTMRSTACFYAPVIGGVTVALSGVIEQMTKFELPLYGAGIPFWIFVVCIGAYLILLCFVLTRLVCMIDGKSTSEFLYEFGRNLPLSVALYIASCIITKGFFLMF